MTRSSSSKAGKRVTIDDVAARAGVSRAAVSQVVNGRGNISPATRQRVKEAAEELSWRPRPAAVALRTLRAQTVALVFNRGPHQPEITMASADAILGLERILAPLNYGLLLHVFDEDPADELAAYRRLAATGSVDGVILVDGRKDDPRFAMLNELGLPGVLLGTPYETDFPHVDNEPPGAGVPETVQHLVELGHTKIAYVGGPAQRAQPAYRQQAFTDSVADAGMSPVATIATHYSTTAAVEATEELMAGSVRPTAIIFGSDGMAMAAMHHLQQSGLTLPRDMSVVGFDGQVFGQYTAPALTTVARDGQQRGRAAATLLLQLIGEDVGPSEVLDLPQLIIRESTAPPPD